MNDDLKNELQYLKRVKGKQSIVYIVTNVNIIFKALVMMIVGSLVINVFFSASRGMSIILFVYLVLIALIAIIGILINHRLEVGRQLERTRRIDELQQILDKVGAHTTCTKTSTHTIINSADSKNYNTYSIDMDSK